MRRECAFIDPRTHAAGRLHRLLRADGRSRVPSGGPPIHEQLQEARRAAVAAYRANDFEAARDAIEGAAALVPNNPDYVYTLAALRARTGDRDGALEELARVAAMGIIYDAAADSSFATLWEDPDFHAIVDRMAENERPIGAAEVAFRLTERDLIPESVAYDPVDPSFYVGSVHKRKIVKHSPSVGSNDFTAGAAAGLMSVLGMKVDIDRRLLWVSSNGIREMVDYDSTLEGVADIAIFSLRDGELLAKRRVPPRDGGRLIGDLAFGRDGVVYLADSRSGEILRMRSPEDSARSVFPPGRLPSLQGIDLFPDSPDLFVADYILGIARVDPKTRSMRILPAPADVCTAGIDGLYCYGGSLIGIQNGVRPHRVVCFDLDAARERIERGEVILQGHPDFDEPTLGVLVPGDLYLVANSHWGAFDAQGRISAPEASSPPVILRLQLSRR